MPAEPLPVVAAEELVAPDVLGWDALLELDPPHAPTAAAQSSAHAAEVIRVRIAERER
ncbi:MAG: hypothetical protein ACRDMX_18415 [Solirubrobacteraceae bacterium]